MEMENSGFFSKEETKFIPPDYSEEVDSDVEDLDETIEPEEEDIIEATEPVLEEEENENKKETKKEIQVSMGTNNSPFGSPIQQSSSPWSNNSGGGWGSQPSNPSWGGFGSFGSQQKPQFGSFGGSSWGSSGNTNGQREQINRNKQVVFIPFLDGLVETYDSNGRPGLPPRDIYDLKPRFAVWEKIAAFNPSRVYSVVPLNAINNSNGDPEGWNQALGYFCCALSAFLRLPFNRCLILAQPTNGQPTRTVINAVLRNSKITKEEAVMLGNYSGINGLSDSDLRTAEQCGIDYVDITQLLNNMF